MVKFVCFCLFFFRRTAITIPKSSFTRPITSTSGSTMSVISAIMWTSNIAQIRLCTVAGDGFVCKCCNRRGRLIRFQFAEHMALIVMRWRRTASYKRKDCPVQKGGKIKTHKSRVPNIRTRPLHTYLLLTGTSPVMRTLQRRSSGSSPQNDIFEAG